jgi:hypothetical protein
MSFTSELPLQELPHVAVESIQQLVTGQEQECLCLEGGECILGGEQGVMYLANLRRV